MNTNKPSWLEGLHKLDTKKPMTAIDGETVYTVYLADFLKMPDVNFWELSKHDVAVRALFN